MAKILADLSLRINADSAELKKNVDQVNSKLGSLKDKGSELGKGLKDVFGAVGEAAGGVAEGIINIGTSVATAAGPLGMLTVLIGGIALAWKNSKENVEAYLRSAEKVKYGAAAFTSESETAMKETEKRIKGGITEGGRLQVVANQALLATDLTDEERKQLIIMRDAGKEMVKNNALLYQSLGLGNESNALLKNGYEWKKKYSDLLLKQDVLDKDKIKNDTEITDLQATLLSLKTQIAATTDPAEKAKLQIQYEATANDIYSKRLGIIDQIRTITGGLLTMTGKEEDLEMLNLNLDGDKADALREYNKNLNKAEMLELKIATAKGKTVKTAEELLRDQKEINTHTEAGYKIEPLKVPGMTPALDKALSTPFQNMLSQIDNTKLADESHIIALNQAIAANMQLDAEMERQHYLLDTLNTSFADLGYTMKQVAEDGKITFGEWIRILSSVVKLLGSINRLSNSDNGGENNDGTWGDISSILGILGTVGALFGYAGGTSYSPGGLALVGESGPELVNLPRGSQVFSNSQSRNMLSGSNEVVFKIQGETLVGVLNKYGRKVNNYA